MFKLPNRNFLTSHSKPNIVSCASVFGMVQAGPLQLPAGTLDLCPCVGSAQCVAVELHSLQWEAAVSLPQ